MVKLLNMNVKNLSDEYRSVLEEALKNLYKVDSLATVDEIVVYWARNNRLVDCILKHNHSWNNAGLFTAAVNYDVEGYEKFPFMLMNKVHYWDDIIPDYITHIECFNDNFDKDMRNITIGTIGDDLKVLNKGYGVIVLPVRYFCDSKEESSDFAKDFFVQMFPKIHNMDEYHEKVHSLSDILENGSPSFMEGIRLMDGEEPNDLGQKLENYRKRYGYRIPDCDDGKLFYFVVIGYLSQVYDIMIACYSYGLIPFFRDLVSFHYFFMIVFFTTKPEDKLDEFKFRTIIYNAIRTVYDSDLISNDDFELFVNFNSEYDFETKLFKELENENKIFKEIDSNRIRSIIKDNLSCFKMEFDKYKSGIIKFKE